jgi:endonuclease/exonuclease/phosphatase family metal-dependent hydrolase
MSDNISSNKYIAWLRRFFFILSAILCLFLYFCFYLRPDFFTAITMIPVWAWCAVGILLTVLGFPKSSKRLVVNQSNSEGLQDSWGRASVKPAGGVHETPPPLADHQNHCGGRSVIILLAIWIIFLLVFAEEPWSLLHSSRASSAAFDTARQRGGVLRVVSLNCRNGNVAAAEEVQQYDPDIVLLQETPRPREVKALAKELYGDEAGTACGRDASLIVHGAILDSPRPESTHYVQARVLMHNGLELEAVSVHLLSPVTKHGFLSDDTFMEMVRNRVSRRDELTIIANQLGAVPRSLPMIVGGDFNAPAGDAIFRLLSPALHDTFKEAGSGWGNTFSNNHPIQRIDQVWVNRRFKTMNVSARKTINSDHRLVVCDLMLAK